jgi:hypothetical protein
MMISKPLFSSPRRFSAGTMTSSRSINVEPVHLRKRTESQIYRPSDLHIPLELTPEFSSFFLLTPFESKGTIKMEIPFAPSGPVLAAHKA